VYEVCSNSNRIGTVVAVHWVGCVCNQSWHVCTCPSNSWHKLQVAAFAQLAAAGRGNNTCVYVIAIFTVCESTKNAFASSFVLKSEKKQRKPINYCSKHTVKMQWVVHHKCLTGSVDLKRVEPPLKATPARDDRQHRETRKWFGRQQSKLYGSSSKQNYIPANLHSLHILHKKSCFETKYCPFAHGLL